MKLGIRFKITFFIVMLVITIMGTVTYIFTIRDMELRIEQVKLRMERLANNIATIRSIETEDWTFYQTSIDNQIKLNPDIVYIAIFDADNELRVHALNSQWLDIDNTHFTNSRESANLVWQLHHRQIAEESQRDLEAKSVNIIIGGINSGMVEVGFSLVDWNDEMRSSFYRNLTLSVIFVILAIGLTLIMSHRIVGPLDKMTKAMFEISKGHLNHKLIFNRRDEIGRMAKAFNFMVQGLQEKFFIENFNRDLGFSLEIEKTNQLITERITNALLAKRGFLFIQNQNKDQYCPLKASFPQKLTKKIQLICDEKTQSVLVQNQEPMLLSDLKALPQLWKPLQKISDLDEKSLVIPIIIQNAVIGFFLLDGKKNNKPYSDDEKQFFHTLVSQGAFAIENGLLIDKLTEQERLQRELEIARKVQQSLLPQSHPAFTGLELHGVCLPAKEVGGDYFDYFILDKETLGIVIADVTGKGTSASFYMAMVKGMMLSLTSLMRSPSKLLVELNRHLYHVMERQKFITMTYAVLDLKKGKMEMARAGHNALIKQDQATLKTECLTPPGIGLGLEKGRTFKKTIEGQTIQLKKGDVYLFYTDGISEAMNSKKQEFGEKQILRILGKIKDQHPRQICDRIIHDVKAFSGKTPQHDDMTMVVAKCV